MKIAFLSTFYPYRGGIAQFNGALYRALEKGNANVQKMNKNQYHFGATAPRKASAKTSE